MPQADTMLAPSVARARSTSAPGIGAPAHRNVRRLGTGCSESATVRARSVRNGVDPMVKVTPASRISLAACTGSQMSCSTACAPSTTGIISPYMKPVWWAIGEAISTTSSVPRCSRPAYGMMLASSVLAVCITPLGSPVVPEV